MTAASVLPVDPRPIQAGDYLRLHVRYYDVGGRLLHSSRASDLAELEANAQNTTPFVVPDLTEEKPILYRMREDWRPTRLDRGASVLVGGAFIGRVAPFTVGMPVIGELTGYVDTVTIPRLRGPFNSTMTISAGVAGVLPLADDGRVQLNDALFATTTPIDDDRVRIDIEAVPGQTLVVRQTGFEALVLPAEEPGQFALKLDTTEGHTFSILRECDLGRYVLAAGSYRVVSVDEENISLERSPTVWAQMIGKPLVAEISVIENVGPVDEAQEASP